MFLPTQQSGPRVDSKKKEAEILPNASVSLLINHKSKIQEEAVSFDFTAPVECAMVPARPWT